MTLLRNLPTYYDTIGVLQDRTVYIIQNELFLVHCLTDCLGYQRVVYLNFILPTSSERLGLVVVL